MAIIVLVDDKLASGPADLTTHRLARDHDLRRLPANADPGTIREALADAEVIVTALAPVTMAMMDAAVPLGLIAKPGAGVDNIDVAAAAARGIAVCNAPGVRGRSVAEHAMFMTLYLSRCGWMAHGHARGERHAFDLAGRTMGLLGLGDIGGRIADMAAGFDMEVVASSPSRDPRRARVPVSFVDPSDLLDRSDVLVLCAPLDSATRGFINREALERMRPGAVLVNVARGPCVNTDELDGAMREGILHGAGLDVTDPEPLPADHSLRALPNVLITPHVGGWSVSAQQAAIDRMVVNIEAHLAGARPPDALESTGR